MELEFSKLNLSPEDILIIKVDITGLSEKESTEKLRSIREDEFVKFVEGKGNKVLVSYSGIEFQILRTKETDKVVCYVDVSSLDETETEDYIEHIKFMLNESIGERLICIPVKNGSPKLAVKSEKDNV